MDKVEYRRLSTDLTAIKSIDVPPHFAGLQNPWFVAKDVCAILEYSDTANGCRILDEDEKDVVMRSELPSLFEESSNAPAMTLISESGLYRH